LKRLGTTQQWVEQLGKNGPLSSAVGVVGVVVVVHGFSSTIESRKLLNGAVHSFLVAAAPAPIILPYVHIRL